MIISQIPQSVNGEVNIKLLEKELFFLIALG
jgi:hypothetical protein